MLCPLNEYIKPLDLSGGEVRKDLMIIGQDPTDVLSQYDAGSLLHQALEQRNVNKDYIHFTSLVKCVGSSGFQECHHHLIDEILSREPVLIIALGPNVATPFMAHIAQQHNQQLAPGMGYTLENGSDMMVLNHPKDISMNQQAMELFKGHLDYAFTHLSNKLRSRI